MTTKTSSKSKIGTMRHRGHVKILLVSRVLGACAWFPATSAFAYDYGAECASTYPSPCSAGTIGDSCTNVTAAQDEFTSIGWSRTMYWANPQAWAQDWKETALGGADHVSADNPSRMLAIWSGHGTGSNHEPDGNWSMWFATKGNTNTCTAKAPGDLIYGEWGSAGWAGDSSNRYVIMDASCSMEQGEISTVWENWGPGIMMGTHQGMGFHNSPTDEPDRLETFVDDLLFAGMANQGAWLDAGEICVTFYCYNSPAIDSHGSTQSDADNRNDHETMIWPMSDPYGWGGNYHRRWIDHGGC